MRWKIFLALIAQVICLILGGVSAATAQCPAVPNQLMNGQTADATQVMADFNALLNCLNTGEFIEAPSPNRQFTGPGGGIITMQNPSATANYNYNLPATAGNTGNFLTSGGGGSAPNTWTSISTNLQLSGGVLDLAPTTVTAGTYTLSTLTVDANGRLTAAANGPSTGASGHVLPLRPISSRAFPI